MRLKISHLTRYAYDAAVPYALLRLRLTPKSRGYQAVLSWRTTVEEGQTEAEFQDQHDNHVELISIHAGRQNVAILSEGEVETTDTHGVYGEHQSFVPLWLFLRSTELTKPGANVRKLVKSLDDAAGNDISRMHDLSAQIRSAVAYQTGSTHAASTAESALEEGNGVCQDHAHIFVSAARLMGFPARYVGGYLMMNDRVDQDAGHAWAEVHVDGVGWIGFDVSNGISPDARYVRVATGLDYTDAAPISGMRLGDSNETMVVTVQVQQQ